jgi:hypothetical protein
MCRLLIVVFAATMLVAAVPITIVAARVLAQTADQVRESQLRLASLAAAHADRGLTEAFFEIELMAIRMTSEPESGGSTAPGGSLRSVLGETTSFHAGVVVLDALGDVVYWEPSEPASDVEHTLPADVRIAAAMADDRVISEPYVDPQTGEVIAALSLPQYAPDGTREATVVGLFDVGGPLLTDLVAPAFDLGSSGHSDLVDAHGSIIAAINPAHGPDTGDHPDFYEAVALVHAPTVMTVSHEPPPSSLDRSEYHVMAYAPLTMAPWGVAIGASEDESMAAVSDQRRSMVVFGASAIGVLLAGLALAVANCRGARRPLGSVPKTPEE